MDVTIIGPGNMGKAIATRALSGGHTVTFIGRTAEKAEEAAQTVKDTTDGNVRVSAETSENAQLGDVVVLAVPYGTNTELARQLGEKLDGKVVIDIANPLNSTYSGLATEPDTSSAEEVASVVPPTAKVVKAFNTTYAGTLFSGQAGGQPLDVFIAGDDTNAKQLVAELVEDGGMRPVDAGPLSRARQIEGMQFLHILLQNTLGTNWGSAIKILN